MKAQSLVVIAITLFVGCSQDKATPVEAENAADALTEPSVADEIVQDKAGAVRPKVYDVEADGFEQIAAALTQAKSDNKRVLLQFGAEWCGWCLRLHGLFESDEQIGATLAANYIVVTIDVDGDHNKAVDEKYGNPTQHGLPVIVVLDTDGTKLWTQNTGDLEDGDHHDPAKVLAFLEKWALQSDATADVAAN